MTQRPNIVMILADDLGWRDLACYGSSFYETPNLDRLAQQGMRLSDAYAACPVCSPTRASMLTGQYPASVGVTNYIAIFPNMHPQKGPVIDAPYLDHVPANLTTYASALRDQANYQTWHVGKWHCGGEGSLPTDHGFEVNVGGCHWGMPYGKNGYFAPWDIPDPELSEAESEIEPGTYLDQYLTDRAVELIENRDPGRPFLLNFWSYLVHTPIQAPAALVEKYRQKARGMRLDQTPGVVEGEPQVIEKLKGHRVHRRLFQGDPVYAAMVEMLDQCVGRLLETLQSQGLDENTLVMFTSDNGGLSNTVRAPTCNHPLHEGKGWMFEGGIREPWIMRWPGVIEPGSECRTPVSSPDVLPTCLELAGVDLPEQPLDGSSLVPAFTNPRSFERGPVFWHFPHYSTTGGRPSSAMRDGDWKLIEYHEDGRAELYDLSLDISEAQDLSAKMPQRVASMREALANWRQQVAARMPEPNPDYVHPSDPASDPTV